MTFRRPLERADARATAPESSTPVEGGRFLVSARIQQKTEVFNANLPIIPMVPRNPAGLTPSSEAPTIQAG